MLLGFPSTNLNTMPRPYTVCTYSSYCLYILFNWTPSFLFENLSWFLPLTWEHLVQPLHDNRWWLFNHLFCIIKFVILSFHFLPCLYPPLKCHPLFACWLLSWPLSGAWLIFLWLSCAEYHLFLEHYFLKPCIYHIVWVFILSVSSMALPTVCAMSTW